MKFFWAIIFFIFGTIEYISSNKLTCGSDFFTGQMWFMWFFMSMASMKLK